MDLFDSMRVFTAVVEAKSLTEAGKRLGLSPSTVSKYISGLEERFGITLLSRTTRRVWVTELGENFYGRCIQILEDIEHAKLELSDLKLRPSGLLRVTAPPLFATRYISPRVPEFLAAHPDLEIELILSGEKVDLAKQEVDVAVRIASHVDPQNDAVPLALSRRVFCAAPSYLARHPTPKRPEDLLSHNALIYSGQSSSGWVFRDGDRIGELAVKGNFVSNNLEAIRYAALAGHGVAQVPTWLVADSLNDGLLVEILPQYRVTPYAVYALTLKKRFVPLKIQSFLDFLRGILGPEPPWERRPD